MTASVAVRTQRRVEELAREGVVGLTMEQVRDNLLQRDRIDSTREDSPLRQAEDAVVIDNSELTPQEQFELALRLAQERISSLTKSVRDSSEISETPQGVKLM